MINSLSVHPFELSGLGTGPYRFVGIVSIPTPALAEANPDAYQGALRDLPRDLVNGCGVCAHCGTPITNVCIVVDAQGRRYGIGSDCVLKTGDPYLGDKAKIAIARLQRDQRRARQAARRAAQHEVWLATVCNEAGETNAQRLERENKERDAAEKARKDAVYAKFGFLLPYLGGPEGGFCASIAEGIRNGHAPSGRALEICSEIYGKAHGRRGSKAYVTALNEFNDKTWEAD
jgi:hypothetical protein